MSDYDGIKEREDGKKKMPIGMTVFFLGLVIFGFVYIYLYMPATTGWTQLGQYERKSAAIAAPAAPVEQKPAVKAMTADEQRIAKGKEIYAAECAMCHGEKLEGALGPALTGPAFLYGGEVKDLIRTTSGGTQAGMPAFEKQLGPEKIRDVALYIRSLRKK